MFEPRPLRLVAQDIGFSVRRQGFGSPRGYLTQSLVPQGFVSFLSRPFRLDVGPYTPNTLIRFRPLAILGGETEGRRPFLLGSVVGHRALHSKYTHAPGVFSDFGRKTS